MAQDHFEKHYYQKDRVDWNFNLTFNNQPQVAAMAAAYKDTLDLPYMYSAIPGQWLHSTILRVGLTDDFTEEEMLAVADILTPQLAELQLPEFIFDPWWIYSGNIVLHISPDDSYRQLFELVVKALETVVGKERAITTVDGHFLSHMTLAYSKTHHNERDIHARLLAHPVQPEAFHATNLALIKQWPTSDGHYEWEVVRDLPIGQTHSK